MFARGLLLRLAAPFAFFVVLVSLQTLGAPAWTLILAVAAGAGLAVAGVAVTRSDAGTGTAARLGTVFREGGYRFVLVGGALLLMVALAGTR